MIDNPSTQRVVCNPVNLAYAFQDFKGLTGKRRVTREAADPSVVLYRGTYYLFVSMTPGFFYSDDLVTWKLHRSDAFPAYDYAPDVREVDGALIISASRRGKPSPFYRTEDPLSDDFEQVTPGTFAFWDPNLFQDDDDRTYFYWGCGPRKPIQGVELDRTTYERVGPAVPLIASDTDRRGWERNGENNDPSSIPLPMKIAFGGRPFIEGAWMTKNDGRYYLQYAAPGTEANVYADGYYVGDGPLGPFDYSPDSPFSAKPGGFITGAGHGSTFQDKHGNWWHAATMRISVNQMFERRVGLFPAGFDADGVLFCNQNFADYPMVIPDRPFDPWTEAFPGWMLLSYRKPVTESSTSVGHGPELAVDEDIRTWWVAGTDAPGESLTVDLGAPVTVHAVQLNLAENDLQQWKPSPGRDEYTSALGSKRAISAISHPTEYVLEASADGEQWTTLWDGRGSGLDSPHNTVTREAGTTARFVRATAHSLPFGAPFAVSGFRVFGFGDGSAPEPVTATASRLEARSAAVSWPAAPGANGYNVRYGRDPQKLYHSWLVYEQTELTLTALNAGEDYWVAVDEFNENGVTPGETVALGPPERSTHAIVNP
ncbi:family 43 glycosylhydrolase [Diaminobutyricibacter sp. McL0618]|uniref:family 43 glycosylhydrolase n=1 Tax=Leifsonia sp. McL0618 TaxID=3415677 RepID=UPI003CF0990B